MEDNNSRENITAITPGFTIKEPKNLRDELYAKSQQLEVFFSDNLDLLCIADREGNFIKVSKGWEELLGFGVKDLGKRNFMEFVHPEDKDLTLGKIKVMQSQNIVVHFINRLVQKDGAIRNIDWHAKLVGSMIYATARDITIRVQAETALEEQTRQFELAVSGSNDGIFDWDLITNEVYFSPKWKEQLGFLDNELPNKLDTFIGRMHQDDREAVMHKVALYFSGKMPAYDLEFRMLHKNATYRWIRARGAALRNASGQAVRMAG